VKILFLNKRVPFPADNGGKIRTLNVLKHLAQWHDITYLCNIQKGEENYLPEVDKLGLRIETIPWKETSRSSLRFYAELFANLFSRYPYNVAKDFDIALKSRAIELLKEESYDLLICDFVQMALNVQGIGGIPNILFQHNVEAEIFERHATSGPGFLRRRYMALQWKKMKRFEALAGRNFTKVVAVSTRDREIYRRDYKWNHVDVIDTAVDVEYFHPGKNEEDRKTVMFLGSMDWLPNIDGVLFFVKEIWPRIRSCVPDAKFQIVGRNPVESIQRLNRESGIEVTGTVDDVRPFLGRASLIAIPLLVGGGTRIKIYEAMAMSKSVVSTSLGAEGLQVQSGVHLEMADQPEDFAEKTINILKNPAIQRTLGQSARNLVVENFSAEKVARQFERICLNAIEIGRSENEQELVTSSTEA